MEKEKNIFIKKMEVFHLNKILKIEKENFKTPWSKQNFEFDILINKYAYYISLFKNKKIIGYAGCWCIFDLCHITTISVQKKYQGKGYSKILLQHLIEYSKSKNCKKATLEVNVNNTVAINLYKSFGFKIVSKRLKYYDATEDAFIMEMVYE